METTNWTEKQRKAYEALKASVAKNLENRPAGLFEKAPKGGWTDKDRIK